MGTPSKATPLPSPAETSEVADGKTATIKSVIAGSCGLMKKGAGDLIVWGANTYTGCTTIKNGKLVLDSGNNRLPTGTTVTLGDSGAGTTGILKLNDRDQQVAGLATSGSSANNQIINGGGQSHTLTVNTSSGDSCFSGVLADGSTGKLKLTKKGSYTLTLSGASTYTGTTTIKAGTLALACGDDRLPTGTTVTLGDSYTAGTLKLNGHNQEVAGLTRANSYSGNQVINGCSSPATLTVNTETKGDCEFAGVLADGSCSSSLSLIKKGDHTLTLSGASTYTGSTKIEAGTLALSCGNNRLPTGTTVTLGESSTAGALKLDGHNQEVAGLGTSGSASGNQVINGSSTGATLTVNTGSGDATLDGGILADGGTGPLALAKKGSYTLTLTGTITYTGATWIQAGTLALGAGSSGLVTSTTVTLGDSCSYGVFKLNGHSQQVAGLATCGGGGSCNQVINGCSTPATLTVNVSSDSTFAGVLADGSGSSSLSIVKAGTGTLSLTGSNSHTGATTISGGVLRAALGTGLPNNSNLVFDGGVWEGSCTFSRSLGTGAGQVRWTGDGGFSAYGGPLTVNLGGATPPSQVTWGSSNFVPDGHVLMFGSAASDNQVEFKNPINMGTSTRTVSVTDNTGSSSDSALLSGNLTWTSGLGLTKSGDGKLVLSGTMSTSYSSANTVTISEGGLQLQSASANPLPIDVKVVLGSAGGKSGVLRLNGVSQELSGLETSGNGSGNRVVNGSATGATLTLDVAGSDTFGGILGGTDTNENNFGLTKDGAGTLNLSGINTYAGATAIQNGRIELGCVNALPTGTVLTLGSGTASGVLNLKGLSQELAGLETPGTGSGNEVVNEGGGGNAYLTLNVADSCSFNFGGVLSGATELIKSGDGTQTLSGANSYTLITWIKDGTLALGGEYALPTGMHVLLGDDTSHTDGILKLNGYSQELASLTACTHASRVINGVSTMGALTLNLQYSQDFDGILGGSTPDNNNFGLGKTGSGTLTLGADADDYFVIDSGELRGKTERAYDELGRVYQTLVYEVVPDGEEAGTIGDHLTSNVWYNPRGMVVKMADPNGLFSKVKYDGAGREIATYTSFDTDESGYTAAQDVSGDTVIEQIKTIYDAGSRPVASLFFQRLETDTTSTADLTADMAYATASVTWYDKGDRVTHVINFGHDSGDNRYIFNSNGSLKDSDSDGIPDEADVSTSSPREPNTSNDYIVAKYQYNDAGLLYRVTDNKAHITETQYDLLGRTTATIANYVDGVDEDDIGTDQTTEYDYDSAGRLSVLRARNPLGENNGIQDQETRYLYESEIDRSWVTNVIYPDSGDTDGPYLDVSSLTRTGTTAWVTTTTNHGYNTDDQVRITGADQAEYNGWFTITREDDYTFTYTVSGSPATPATGTIEVKKLGADEVKTTYDRLGRPLTVTDQRGVEHTYTYDTAGRLQSDAVTALPEDGSVDDAVLRIEWAYDDLSRVSTVTSYDAATGGTAVNQVAYTYDSWGNVASSREAHDGAVGQNTPEVDYAYDDGAGEGDEAKYVRLTSVTYPNGGVVTYHYDGADGLDDILSRLSRIADEEDETTYVEYTYLGAATIVQVDHPAVYGGLTLSYGSEGTYDAWDRFGRVVDQTWTVDDDPVDSYGYTYDGNSNRLTRSNPLHTAYSESYAYDGLDRLTGMERATSTHQDWGLDALGNWAGYVESDGETTTLDQSRTHDEANQIGEIDATIGEDWIDPAYDDAGNMIYAPRPGDEANADEALLFVYDGWNRLVKVYKDDGESQGQIDEEDTPVAAYEYDGLGRRIQRTVGETTDDYYYNEGWQVLETRRGGVEYPLDQFIWDVRYVDSPVVRFHDGNTDGDLDGGSQEGDNTLYYTTDANWNVTALVDAATGDVVERYMYDAYGKATVLNGANGTDPDVNGSTVFEWDVDADGLSDVANDVLFAGYRFDGETGLYAVRNRTYHPTLGRWIERDPAGYLDGANLYGYVSGNPAGRTDPSGLCGETAPEPGHINPWWIKRTGPNTFEMLLPWIEGMGTEIRLLPFLPRMRAVAIPMVFWYGRIQPWRTVTFPIDGKPALVVTTTDNIDPDKMDEILKSGHAIVWFVRWFPSVQGTGLYPGKKIANQMSKPNNMRKYAEAYVESRVLWIRLEIGHLDETGEVVVQATKWFALEFGPERGTNAEDVSREEVQQAIKRLRDKLLRQ